MDRLNQQADSMAQLTEQDDELLFRDLTKILEDDDDAEAQLRFTNMIEAFDAEHDFAVASPLGAMGDDERSPSDYGSYNGISSLVSAMPSEELVLAPIEQPQPEVVAPVVVMQHNSEPAKAAPTHHYRRRTANARERIRMREINQAFEKLKARVPVELIQQSHDAGELSDQCSESAITSGRAEKQKHSSNPESIKLTKINTLRLAVSYISKLTELLNETKQQHETSQVSEISTSAAQQQQKKQTKEAITKKPRKRAPRKVNSTTTTSRKKCREKFKSLVEEKEIMINEKPNHIKCEVAAQQVKLAPGNYCTSASASPEPVKQIIVFHLYSNTIAFHQQQMLGQHQSASQSLAASNAGAGGTLQIIRPNYQQQQYQQQQLCLLNQTHGSQQIICAPQPQPQSQPQQQQVVQVQPPPPQQPQLCFVAQQQQPQHQIGSQQQQQQILNSPPAQQQETVNQVMASLATSIKSTTRSSSPVQEQPSQQQQRPPIRQYRFHNYDGNMMMPPINSN